MLKKFLFCTIGLFFFTTTLAIAHGTLEIPISRVYNCYKEGPESPKSAACKAAVAAGGTQALYDWNGINQGAANDKHQQIIPDGTLCAGGRSLFQGMNLARSDWSATTITPNSAGQFQFVWYATAPHAIKYFRFYMTKDGYDLNQPLKWSDLDAPFCTVTSAALQNSRYKLTCPLPKKSGKRIIFVIWQRSDSAEAFYACSDVMLNGGTPTPPPTAPTWTELSALYANAAVTLNSKVVFRLFKNGQEVEKYSMTAVSGQNLANQWPYYLGLAVNSGSSLVKIGQINAQTNQVTPLLSSTLNKIYINGSDVSTYSYGIDFIAPNEQVDYIYPDGIGSYAVGTVAMGTDQKRYKCKIGPWCNGPSLYYAPGTGLAWQEAWTLQ